MARCPVCGAELGHLDDVITFGRGEPVGCSECLGLYQAEEGEVVRIGESGEVLTAGEWYYRERASGRAVGGLDELLICAAGA